MQSLLKASAGQAIRRGLFNIDIRMPGMALGNPDDPHGLAQLGRFDHAHLYPGVFVAMHPHRNDEILTYMRSGTMVHEDTAGETAHVSNTHLMLMNSGSGIRHQESIPDDGEEVRLLQIFLRPEVDDIPPRVQFAEFENPNSLNRWRLVAGPEDAKAPLTLYTHASVYDARLEADTLPLPAHLHKTYLLYVFAGKAQVGELLLSEGDTFIYSKEQLEVSAEVATDLVLFELDMQKPFSRNGMYSGMRR